MKSFKISRSYYLKMIKSRYVIIVLLITILSGCQSSLNYSTLKYGKAEIQALLADSSFSYLVLQFKSTNGQSSKNPFTLISYAFDTSNIPINTIPYNLMDSGTTPKIFKDSLIMGNQMASRQNLLEALTDPGTQAIVNYDFLVFTPQLDPSNHYVYYTITPGKITPDSSAVVIPSSITQPCPPAICRAPVQQ